MNPPSYPHVNNDGNECQYPYYQHQPPGPSSTLHYFPHLPPQYHPPQYDPPQYDPPQYHPPPPQYQQQSLPRLPPQYVYGLHPPYYPPHHLPNPSYSYDPWHYPPPHAPPVGPPQHGQHGYAPSPVAQPGALAQHQEEEEEDIEYKLEYDICLEKGCDEVAWDFGLCVDHGETKPSEGGCRVRGCLYTPHNPGRRCDFHWKARKRDMDRLRQERKTALNRQKKMEDALAREQQREQKRARERDLAFVAESPIQLVKATEFSDQLKQASNLVEEEVKKREAEAKKQEVASSEECEDKPRPKKKSRRSRKSKPNNHQQLRNSSRSQGKGQVKEFHNQSTRHPIEKNFRYHEVLFGSKSFLEERSQHHQKPFVDVLPDSAPAVPIAEYSDGSGGAVGDALRPLAEHAVNSIIFENSVYSTFLIRGSYEDALALGVCNCQADDQLGQANMFNKHPDRAGPGELVMFVPLKGTTYVFVHCWWHEAWKTKDDVFIDGHQFFDPTVNGLEEYKKWKSELQESKNPVYGDTINMERQFILEPGRPGGGRNVPRWWSGPKNPVWYDRLKENNRRQVEEKAKRIREKAEQGGKRRGDSQKKKPEGRNYRVLVFKLDAENADCLLFAASGHVHATGTPEQEGTRRCLAVLHSACFRQFI